MKGKKERGLAIDTNNVDPKFENSPAFEWLMENATDPNILAETRKYIRSHNAIDYVE